MPALLMTAGAALGCTDLDARLDSALEDYLAQREAEVTEGCKCHQNVLDPSNPEGTFDSEQACLDAFEQPARDQAITCMRGVLGASSLDVEDSIAAVECYAREVSEAAACHQQNAEVCEAQACSSDIVVADECQGKLTDEQVQAFYYCAAS